MGRAQGREPRLLAMQLDGACSEEEVRGGVLLFATVVLSVQALISLLFFNKKTTRIQLTGALEMISASTDTVEVFFRKALERRWVASAWGPSERDAVTCSHSFSPSFYTVTCRYSKEGRL